MGAKYLWSGQMDLMMKAWVALVLLIITGFHICNQLSEYLPSDQGVPDFEGNYGSRCYGFLAQP